MHDGNDHAAAGASATLGNIDAGNGVKIPALVSHANATVHSIKTGPAEDPAIWSKWPIKATDLVCVCEEHVITVNKTLECRYLGVEAGAQLLLARNSLITCDTLLGEPYALPLVGEKASLFLGGQPILPFATDPSEYAGGLVWCSAATLTNCYVTSKDPGARRAHTLFTGWGDVRLPGSKFEHLGRTDPLLPPTSAFGPGGNQIGRYSVHSHMKAEGRLICEGVEVAFSKKGGIVFHGSSGGVATGCYVHDCGGGGIIGEDLAAHSLTITNNRIERITGSGKLPGEDALTAERLEWREGTGIWFASDHNQTVTDNRIKAVDWGGIGSYAGAGKPDKFIPSRVNANTVDGCAIGFDLWNWATVFEYNTATNCRQFGLWSYYTNAGARFRYLTVTGDPTTKGGSIGLRTQHWGADIEDCVVRGFGIGQESASTSTMTTRRVDFFDCLLDRKSITDSHYRRGTALQAWEDCSFSWFNAGRKPEVDLYIYHLLGGTHQGFVPEWYQDLNRNRVAGESYRYFHRCQTADYPTIGPAWAKRVEPVTGPIWQNVPEDGLTNQQAWDRYGMALSGAIMPEKATELPWLDGEVGAFLARPVDTAIGPEGKPRGVKISERVTVPPPPIITKIVPAAAPPGGFVVSGYFVDPQRQVARAMPHIGPFTDAAGDGYNPLTLATAPLTDPDAAGRRFFAVPVPPGSAQVRIGPSGSHVRDASLPVALAPLLPPLSFEEGVGRATAPAPLPGMQPLTLVTIEGKQSIHIGDLLSTLNAYPAAKVDGSAGYVWPLSAGPLDAAGAKRLLVREDNNGATFEERYDPDLPDYTTRLFYLPTTREVAQAAALAAPISSLPPRDPAISEALDHLERILGLMALTFDDLDAVLTTAEENQKKLRDNLLAIAEQAKAAAPLQKQLAQAQAETQAEVQRREALEKTLADTNARATASYNRVQALFGREIEIADLVSSIGLIVGNVVTEAEGGGGTVDQEEQLADVAVQGVQTAVEAVTGH